VSAPYTMEALQALADDGVHLLEVDDAGLVATVQECATLRARVAELEEGNARRQVALEAELEGMRQRARVAEAQRDEAVSLAHESLTESVRARAASARLREALERLLEVADIRPLADNDDACQRFEAARADLASAPSAEPTPHEAYMRVAEAVRETCALHLRMSPRFEGVLTTPNDNGVLGRAAQDLENLDLAAVVAKALEVGT